MEAVQKVRTVIGFSRMEKKYEWKDHVIFMGLLLGLAVWVNQGIEIKGLYMDDLYLWSCYGEQSFLQYVFPVGSTRFRFLHYLAAWLEMMFVGNHVGWFVPFNIALNTMVAWFIYFFGRKLSRAKAIGFLAAAMYLASRMAYYQIGQVLGLMETMALWMAVGICWQLYHFLNEEEKNSHFLKACILYFAVCFVHERYMVLFPLLLVVLVMKKSKNLVHWGSALGAFFLVQLIRFLTIGTVLPAGTGRTKVAETFQLKEALGFALDEIAYVFGINAGPEYLNGIPWMKTPFGIRALILTADFLILLLVLGFVWKLIKEKNSRIRKKVLSNTVLFVLFIGMCIACSCVTIRLEMRWIYVSLAGALLFLCYMYGVLTKEVEPQFYLKRICPWGLLFAGYVLLMLPVEMYYRTYGYPHLYLWPEQSRYNSLAQVTYEKYGQEMEGKTVYIIGNSYEVSDFTARTFFKVFQKNRTEELTKIEFIDTVWDIGLVDETMLVLKEDPDHNAYLDVTEFVKDMKLKVDYGYYEDLWMDEHGQVTVMAGGDGKINMEFMFPGIMEGGEMITVTKEGEEPRVIPLHASVIQASIQAEPWERVKLTFDFNFYTQNAREQRGEDRLATLVRFTVN